MMIPLLHSITQALLMAVGMFWQVGWSLVLGFALSGLLQVMVSRERMTALLGRNGPREIAVATAAGAASSSCSYAAASVSRTLLTKGAALIPALSFLFASTNLVIELGLVLLLLMGWQFMAGEWIGGVLLILILSILVRLTYPRALVDEARRRAEPQAGHEHGPSAEGSGSLIAKLLQRETWVSVAQHFVMDWSMLWKDLLLGFLIAGALSVFVPDGVWQTLFVKGASPWVQVPANALIGPLVAVLSFVCSIGNVPMAAVLWGSGVSFGGVLAFLYADLLVLPLIDVYRRYYGWKMAAYMVAVFYATMVLSAIIMDVVFGIAGWIPSIRPNIHAEMTHFSLNYTFWLNLAFGLLAGSFVVLARRHPTMHAHCAHHSSPERNQHLSAKKAS